LEKKRIEIENFCAKMVSADSLGNRRTLRKLNNEALDEALYIWFCHLMTYFEKQSETSSAELLTLRRLRHRTAKLRQSSLKQKNITEFFKS